MRSACACSPGQPQRLHSVADCDATVFMLQARVLAGLNHPNIIRYFETFVDNRDGRLMVVMELAEARAHHLLVLPGCPGCIT